MSSSANKSLADRIIKASFVIGIAHIFLKFAGLIQVKFATQFLDASLYEPIMVVAFTGVINSLFLIGEEIIGPTSLSIFMKEKENQGEKSAWSFVNVVLTYQALLLIAVVSSIICFPDFYIGLFTKWTEVEDPSRYQLLRQSLQVLAPTLFFLSVGSTTYMMLNGYKKFFLAAFGDASTKLCIILGLLVGMKVFGMDHRALFLGILIGSAAKVFTHAIGLGKGLLYLRPSLNWRNPAFRTMLIVMLPLLAGTIFAKVRDNFNNIYVLTHIDKQGILMANDLGRKLFATIQWLVPYTLQIALFPFLCELVSQRDREKLGAVLGSSCKLLLAVFAPAAILLAILGEPLSVLIFFGGKTGIELASWAGLSTACYCLALPATAVECVLMQGFFADQRTVSVTVIGVLASLVSVIINYIFIVHVGVTPQGALMVVALGFVISRCLKSVALAMYFERNTPMFERRDISVFFLKLLTLSAAVGVGTWLASTGMNMILPDGTSTALSQLDAGVSISRLRIILRLAAAGGTGAAVYLLGSHALSLAEPRQMIGWALEKVLKKPAAKKAQ